uniref:P45/P48 n=1 Tax=Pieris brassicae granulosis virus TaxID=10465 RepID=A0A7G9U8V8_GVPB|nr:P45/P48 [Pieris brassicae granulovirus]
MYKMSRNVHVRSVVFVGLEFTKRLGYIFSTDARYTFNFFALFKTNMSEVDEQVFSVDSIITNTLLQFFYNLLSDKATPQFWNFKKCNPLIESCREYVLGAQNVEYLLLNLNSSTYNTKIYTPLRQFMEKHFGTKQIGKLIHKIFIGFTCAFFGSQKNETINA